MLPSSARRCSVAELFERGWHALKAGSPDQALIAFDEALANHPNDSLAEDTAFWRAIALRRLKRTAEATAALTAFVARYPHSPRAGEAAVMLGWMELDAGDLESATRSFEAARDDPTKAVRDNATRGLAAVAARR